MVCRVLVLLVEALAELPRVTRRQLVVLHQRFDFLAHGVERRVLLHVAGDRDRRQAIDAFDGAWPLGDAEIRDRGQRHARAGRQVDGKFGQVVDGLPVGFAERQAQREFAFGAAEFAQSIAAHAGGHGLRDVGGGEAERGGALPIDHDLHFLVAFARLGTHRLEALRRST